MAEKMSCGKVRGVNNSRCWLAGWNADDYDICQLAANFFNKFVKSKVWGLRSFLFLHRKLVGFSACSSFGIWSRWASFSTGIRSNRKPIDLWHLRNTYMAPGRRGFCLVFGANKFKQLLSKQISNHHKYDFIYFLFILRQLVNFPDLCYL